MFISSSSFWKAILNDNDKLKKSRPGFPSPLYQLLDPVPVIDFGSRPSFEMRYRPATYIAVSLTGFLCVHEHQRWQIILSIIYACNRTLSLLSVLTHWLLCCNHISLSKCITTDLFTCYVVTSVFCHGAIRTDANIDTTADRNGNPKSPGANRFLFPCRPNLPKGKMKNVVWTYVLPTCNWYLTEELQPKLGKETLNPNSIW